MKVNSDEVKVLGCELGFWGNEKIREAEKKIFTNF
jgi:hypothetical protein